MRKRSLRWSGTLTSNGASVLFFGTHWIFAIFEPSGNGLPLPGMPNLKASIITGLATITLITSSVLATETTSQPSYPLNSDSERPLGTCTAYLSGFGWAKGMLALHTTSPATTIAIRRGDSLFMAYSLVSIPEQLDD